MEEAGGEVSGEVVNILGIAVGLDFSKGVYTREGQWVISQAELDGDDLAADSLVDGLASVGVAADGDIDLNATFSVDDGDNNFNEQIFLGSDIPAFGYNDATG